MLKLFIANQADRENVAIALIRNGYTVRLGAEKKRVADTKKSSYIEYSDGKSDE